MVFKELGMFYAVTIPEEYQDSFRRLLPYMIPSLRADRDALEAILLYLKLGDERLAKIAIEAMNADRRLSEAALRRKNREESMLREQNEDVDVVGDDDGDDDGDGDDDDDNDDNENDPDDDGMPDDD
jgi:hypothetical protein